MKSRKGLLVLAIVLFGGLFFAFKTSGIGSAKDIILTPPPAAPGSCGFYSRRTALQP